MISIGASCGSATKPPSGSEPNEYSTPLIVFFQSGLPNQTPNFSITKPPPARREKMAQLMDHDEEIKKDDDLEKDKNDAKDVQQHWN